MQKCTFKNLHHINNTYSSSLNPAEGSVTVDTEGHGKLKADGQIHTVTALYNPKGSTLSGFLKSSGQMYYEDQPSNQIKVFIFTPTIPNTDGTPGTIKGSIRMFGVFPKSWADQVSGK